MNTENIEWTYLDEPTYNNIADAEVIAVGKSFSGVDVEYHYQLAGEISSVDIEGTLVYEEEK